MILWADALASIQAATFRYRWDGLPLIKSPFELANIPLLIGQLRPGTIFEIGSWKGGSAIWMRSIARSLGLDTHVYSADTTPPAIERDGVTFVQGTTARPFSDAVLQAAQRPWLVVEDASHTSADTLACLRFFATWLHVGDYYIVEDGIVDALGLGQGLNGGPLVAIRTFLDEMGGDYEIDRTYADFWGPNMTWAPDGYLRRVRHSGFSDA